MLGGTVIAGRYRLDSPLAHGGMGSVWTARHVLLGARVAIKFISPHRADASAARARFEREARVAALLQSRHVVRILDYGVDGGTPYLVMELLDGEDLAARLAARGRLSLGETSRIVAQVARALRRAADASIVHRDLKPANVFLAREDVDDGEPEVVKVLDFGVAKAPRLDGDGDVTQMGALLGSPRYMSPEQARNSAAVDARADLWSLAVIAYRAITGAVPFGGAEPAEVLFRVCRYRAPPPSEIAPELGREVDAFFARALARDLGHRFQTAGELALAFAAAAGLSPPALTSSPPPRRPSAAPGEPLVAQASP